MIVESTKERCVGGAHFEQSQKQNKFNKNTLFLSSADFTDVHKNSVEEKKKSSSTLSRETDPGESFYAQNSNTYKTLHSAL